MIILNIHHSFSICHRVFKNMEMLWRSLRGDWENNNSSAATNGKIFSVSVAERKMNSKQEMENEICQTKTRSKVNSIGPWTELNNNPTEDQNIPWRYFWSGCTGMIFALVNSCLIYCAWPQNHIFFVPKAWHEFMITASIGFIGLFSASFILNSEIWMNIKSMKSWRNFILLYMISAFVWVLVNVGYYHVYSVMLGLSPPMPLNIHVCPTLTLCVVMCIFWFFIPSPVRSGNKFWKRYAYYVLAQVFRYMVVLIYTFITWLFVVIDDNYQWVIGIILPIIREINSWILTVVCYKAAGVENSAIKVTCNHEMSSRHAVFLCVALSLLANQTCAFVALGTDFAVYFLICIIIIWRSKKQKKKLATEDDAELQILALNEKCDVIIPVAYLICFFVAYIGPNSRIIGHVGNESWHWKKGDPPFFIMGVLFLVDFISIFLWAFLLKIFSKISYLNGYMYIQKHFWLIMAIHEAFALNEVSEKC